MDNIKNENIRIPLIGEHAPAFEGLSTQGTIVFPNDYKDKWVVLFSHPADFTPVCTTEFIGFQNKKKEFDKRGVELIGYSIDGIHSHIAWVKNIKENFDIDIDFPIISTPTIAQDYGMLQPSASNLHTVRAVFIINPKGKIAALMYYPLSNGRNVDEIIRLIDSLQITYNHNRATPENWPNNTIFGSDVIIPPATSIKESIDFPQKYNNKDWYLCFESKPKSKLK